MKFENIENKYDYFIKWIDLIEKCIERMASNSLDIKKLTVSIIVAVIALVPKEANVETKTVFICLIVGIFSFYLLDSYYLMIERAYKKKYEKITVDFDSDLFPSETLFNMKISKEDRNFKTYLKCLSSPSELVFYFMLLIMCAFLSTIKICMLINFGYVLLIIFVLLFIYNKIKDKRQ